MWIYVYMYICIYIYLSNISIYLSIHPSIRLSACLPVCLSVCLTVSLKTQQFCETSSIFALDNIKNEIILRDFLNCRSWQYHKSCHGKFIFADPLQMTHACHRSLKCYKILTFCSLLTRCTIPCACHAKRHLNVQKCSVPLSFLHSWLGNVLRATTACTFSTSQLPKVVRTRQIFTLLTWKCASRQNGVHFFDNAISSSAPNVGCF